MIKNTIFIVGAGASQEARLPTGNELKVEISRLLDMRFDTVDKQESGDRDIMNALRIHIKRSDRRDLGINSYIDEALHIRDALPQAISIDNFIDTHRDNEKIALCGKLAIVRSILNAEKKSLLYFKKLRIDSNINFGSLEGTWYIPLFQLITENCNKSELKERFSSITFIIFNYDRCIEHFMYYALQNYYRISEAEAAELIKNIKIYHPYGDVGALPWGNQEGATEFGDELRAEQILELSRNIKTFTESSDPESSEILEIRKQMSIADRIVFLGFAFHKLNTQLIAPENNDIIKYKGIDGFATTFNISDSDKRIIDVQIKQIFPQIILNMANLSCNEFFKYYRRSLSF